MFYARKIIIILLILISIPALFVGFYEFNAAYPTKLLCGRVISRPEEAIEMAAKSIVGWDKDLLRGLTPAEYVKDSAFSSARLEKSLNDNWSVSIRLPTRCRDSVEAAFGVLVCGGGSWIIGSAPSSSLYGRSVALGDPEEDVSCQ